MTKALQTSEKMTALLVVLAAKPWIITTIINLLGA